MDRGLVKSLKHWGERLEAGFNDEGGREIYGKRASALRFKLADVGDGGFKVSTDWYIRHVIQRRH